MQSRTWVLIAVLVLAIGLLWVARQRRGPASPQPPPPTPLRTDEAARPSPTAVATSTPEAPLVRRSTVVLPWESEPTQSPTPSEEEPTPRPGPPPTPEVPECVALTYETGVLPGSWAGSWTFCWRTAAGAISTLEVWFWVEIPAGDSCRACVVTPSTRSCGTPRAKPPSFCPVPSTGTTE
jgi:hypothetical protein